MLYLVNIFYFSSPRHVSAPQRRLLQNYLRGLFLLIRQQALDRRAEFGAYALLHSPVNRNIAADSFNQNPRYGVVAQHFRRANIVANDKSSVGVNKPLRYLLGLRQASEMPLIKGKMFWSLGGLFGQLSCLASLCL